MSGTTFPTRNRYSVPHDRNLSPPVEVTQQQATGHLRFTGPSAGKEEKHWTWSSASRANAGEATHCSVVFMLSTQAYVHNCHSLVYAFLGEFFFFFYFKTAFISCAHSEQIFASLDWEILLIVPILRCWFNVMAGWFGSSYRLFTGSRWDDEIKSDEAQLLRKYMSTLNHTFIELDVVLLPMWVETCLFLCTYTMR